MWDQGQAFAVETVDVTTWDDFAEQYNLVGNVTMMKIDVEGWESFVLEGGAQTLLRADAPVLQVEFSDENAQKTGVSCARLYKQLTDLGYEMFVYNEKLNELRPSRLRDYYDYVNLFAIKRIADVQFRLQGR